MKGLLILSAVAACAFARPDIGLKLREQASLYQPPATSYGVPTGSYLPPQLINTQSAGGNGYAQSGNIGYTDNTGYVSGNTGFTSGNGGFTSGNAGFASGNAGFTSGNTGYPAENVGYDTGNAGNVGISIGNTGFTSGTGEYSGGSLYTSGGSSNVNSQDIGSISASYPGPSHVHKHVYFFDAPEDNETPQLRVKVQPAAGHKNYKIIFIKAPTYKAPQITQVPAIQQNEDKTLVYVLVKKPEETQDIVIPSSIQSKPTKPEVYFIKYKTQKEAEEKIHSIQSGANAGDIANAVNSGSDFIKNIDDSKHISLDTSVSSISTIQSNDSAFESQDQGNVQTVQSGHAHYGPPGPSGPY